ncbi:MAG: HIT domain-containing protein [Alphaproteobacteria bacterium]|nr:HIT domain-containing protein [Alphaproteobacteria bacterium]MDE2630301.1 HIT domain-containing protein [Alphaproteobacteria bacterium]
MEFDLDPDLTAASSFVADWPLSRVLLMNDARFPWLVLVPRRSGAREIFDLSEEDRLTLSREYCRAGERLKALTQAWKINIAALGNAVAQLHVHVIARNQDDPVWPSPVWSRGYAVPYEPAALAKFLSRLVNGL